MQLEGSSIRLHRFLTAVPIRQRSSQSIPQQVVLDKGWDGLIKVNTNAKIFLQSLLDVPLISVPQYNVYIPLYKLYANLRCIIALID